MKILPWYLILYMSQYFVIGWESMISNSKNVNISRCVIPKQSRVSTHNVDSGIGCKIEMLYIPSIYEMNHMEKAAELTKSGLTEIIAFVTSESELKSNKLWLDRVHERMTNMLENDINEVDLKYLSRYNMTKTCKNSVKSWFEWIEPLTIHSRHPFSFISAIIQGHKREDLSRTLPTYATSQKDVLSVDHILVQSAPSFHHRYTSHRRFSTFIIDAGCSEGFDVSTEWLTCAYAQHGLVADQIYSWESQVFEPNSWWNRASPQWYNRLHFLNVPISNEPGHKDNPVSFIEKVAQPDDFVSIKIDVDASRVEIPIVLQILHNQSIHELIDELMFEFHYHCPVLEPYWQLRRTQDPEEMFGVKLNRLGAMTMFQDLRKRGVRSHFWP